MEIQKVLSLFNGMNCIGLAMSEMGIPAKIYASEIDKHANKASSALFPDTVNLGCVKFLRKALCWKMSTLNKAFESEYISTKSKNKLKALLYLRDIVFDVVAAGSPCQGFSFAGKQLNFKDSRSKLFFEFVAILKYCQRKNPKLVWVLENVRMKKEYKQRISELLGINPFECNSKLLSAQNRERLYWTNVGIKFQSSLFGPISNMMPQPKDRKILLKDILELEPHESYYLKTDKKGKKKKNQAKASCFTAGGNSGGNHSDMDLIKIIYKNDKHKLIVPEATKRGFVEIEDGQGVDLTFLKSTTRRGRKMGTKSNCLTAANYNYCLFKDMKIRRLTLRECCHLQTIPEWAIEILLNCGVSASQIYKMLGNGWTVAVIVYILSFHFKKND